MNQFKLEENSQTYKFLKRHSKYYADSGYHIYRARTFCEYLNDVVKNIIIFAFKLLVVPCMIYVTLPFFFDKIYYQGPDVSYLFILSRLPLVFIGVGSYLGLFCYLIYLIVNFFVDMSLSKIPKIKNIKFTFIKSLLIRIKYKVCMIVEYPE